MWKAGIGTTRSPLQYTARSIATVRTPAKQPIGPQPASLAREGREGPQAYFSELFGRMVERRDTCLRSNSP